MTRTRLSRIPLKIRSKQAGQVKQIALSRQDRSKQPLENGDAVQLLLPSYRPQLIRAARAIVQKPGCSQHLRAKSEEIPVLVKEASDDSLAVVRISEGWLWNTGATGVDCRCTAGERAEFDADVRRSGSQPLRGLELGDSRLSCDDQLPLVNVGEMTLDIDLSCARGLQSGDAQGAEGKKEMLWRSDHLTPQSEVI